MPRYSSFIPHLGEIPYDLFTQIARECKDEDIIVEVGAFLGHATCFMAEELQAAGKRPKFYAFDSWDQQLERVYGSMRTDLMPWSQSIEDWKRTVGGPTPLYDTFLANLNGCPAKDRVYDFAQFPASTVAEEFPQESVSFVFLNYSRYPAEIKRQIDSWWPRLKSGGLLAAWTGTELQQTVKP